MTEQMVELLLDERKALARRIEAIDILVEQEPAAVLEEKEWVGLPERKQAPAGTDNAVHNHLRNWNDQTLADIQEGTGLSETQVRYYLRALRNAGLLVTDYSNKFARYTLKQ